MVEEVSHQEEVVEEADSLQEEVEAEEDFHPEAVEEDSHHEVGPGEAEVALVVEEDEAEGEEEEALELEGRLLSNLTGIKVTYYIQSMDGGHLFRRY